MLSNLYGKLKNKIKRVFKRKETFIWGDQKEKKVSYTDQTRENQLETLWELVEQIYTFIKDFPIDERKRVLIELSPKDTDEKLIDYMMECIAEIERQNLRRIEDTVKEKMIQERLRRKSLTKEERKEEDNPHFPDKMIEDFPFDR